MSNTATAPYYPPATFSPTVQSAHHQFQLSLSHCHQPAGLPTRYRIRPLEPEDIPSVAHLLSHAFSVDNELGVVIGDQPADLYLDMKLKLEYLINDRMAYVCEDTQFNLHRTTEGLTYQCSCHQQFPDIPDSDATSPPACCITTIALMHDCYSNWLSLPLSHKDDDLHNAVGPLFGTLDQSPICDPSYVPEPDYSQAPWNASPQTPANPVNRLNRPPGVHLKLLYLACHRYYGGRNLSKYLSSMVLEAVLSNPHLANYTRLSIEASAVPTEKIWTQSLPGRVIRKLKPSEFDYQCADGVTRRIYAPIQFEFKKIELDLVKIRQDKLFQFQAR